MNHNIYRLVRNACGLWVAAPEFARTPRKTGVVRSAAILVSGMLVAADGMAAGALPVPCAGGTCGTHPGVAVPFVGHGQAAYSAGANAATVSQVGNKAILNWRNFNLGRGNSLTFQQVNNLTDQQLVKNASFSTLNRIWDADPSVIAGRIQTAAGQQGNLMFINQNGILFANGAQINVNSLTASSLNIKDTFFLDQLTPANNVLPQFEGTGGFVKVLEGARISADKNGRVMMIAPTVTNRGSISTPDGQTILAAGEKVYLTASDDYALRGLMVEVDNASLSGTGLDALLGHANTAVPATVALDGETLPVADAYDKLGTATNLGDISTPRGNATLVGLAVNQMNKVSATTSVNFNGSVYLMARDTALNVGSSSAPALASTRAGRLTLGGDSRTEVLPELGDKTTSLDEAGFNRSRVEMVGRDIRVESGAEVVAKSGEINFSAVMDPSKLTQFAAYGISDADPFVHTSGGVLDTSIRIGSHALLDVSGVDVTLPVSRNFVEITLRGDELKDSPLNRAGPLRGQKVWVDLTRGSSLIANIEDYQKNIGRTVDERSTEAGVVRLQSQGDTVVDRGAHFDLHGGRINYTGEMVRQTKVLGADGKSYDIATAPADIRYTGVANVYVKDYGRWGVKEVYDRGQKTYLAGFEEGKNAGALVINSRRALFAGNVDGRVTYGANQIQSGNLPQGARLQLGAQKTNDKGVVDDFGLLQDVVVDHAPVLPEHFDLYAPLSGDQQATLHLDTGLLGADGFNRLEIDTNHDISIAQPFRLDGKGSLSLLASNIDIGTDISISGGSLTARASHNVFDVSTTRPVLEIGHGVTLSTAGRWINDGLTGTVGSEPRTVDGGSVSLTAVEGNLVLGENALLDVRGGGYRGVNGKVAGGKGGNITLSAWGIHDAAGAGVAGLARHFASEAIGSGGKLTISAMNVEIGGTSSAGADTLKLGADFFTQGFSSYAVNGLAGLSVADRAVVSVRTSSLVADVRAAGAATGSDMRELATGQLSPEQTRKPASLALGTSTLLDVPSTLRIGTDAVIDTDPAGTIALSASRAIEIDGTLRTPGGVISATVNNPVADGFDASGRLHLGSHAVLDASGVARVYPDSKGMQLGEVKPGGTVALTALTGYVDADAGSRINVNGAAPVRVDIPGDAGHGLGVPVASDAGTVNVVGKEGVFLDGELNAMAGAAGNRGGAISVQVGDKVSAGETLHVGDFGATGPVGFLDESQRGHGYVDLAKLVGSGFDRVSLGSLGTLRFEGDFSAGLERGGMMEFLRLDAPNLVSDGGRAAVAASIVQMGNFGSALQELAGAPLAGSGTLQVSANLLELTGKAAFSGFGALNFTSQKETRLTGVAPASSIHGAGRLDTLADVSMTAAVISPSSLTDYEIHAPGQQVAFHSVNGPSTPLSALGNLTVNAAEIVQGGRIVAPLGSISLNATDRLTLESGSTTSVAAPQGLVVPLGKTLNGRDWFVDVNNDNLVDSHEVIGQLPGKRVSLNGKDIQVKAGSTVNISGGGDLQAWEFTAGTGGSRDVLAQAGYYAILPGYQGLAAPSDPQPDGVARPVGEAVYLDGGNGLAAGIYTLLPAHYALLPGAYAVKLTDGTKDLRSGQGYTRQDGIRVMPGYLTDSRNQTRDARWTGFQVLTRDQVRQRSEFGLSSASTFFADRDAGTPADAGLLSLTTQRSLELQGRVLATAEGEGRQAAVDIRAPRIAVVNGGGGASDEVVLQVAELNALNVDSLLLGATRSEEGDQTRLDVGAERVRIANDAAHPLTGREVMLAATDTVALESGSAVTASGRSGDAGIYAISGNGAFVRVAATDATVQRDGTVDRSKGSLTGAADATLKSSRAMILDATRNNDFSGDMQFSNAAGPVAGSLVIGGARMNFGSAPVGAEGLSFDAARLSEFSGLESLRLRSYSTFDFYGNATLGEKSASGYSLNAVTLEGSGLRGFGAAGDTVSIQAADLHLSNPDGTVFGGGATGNATLTLDAGRLMLGEGEKQVAGFGAVTVNAGEISGHDAGSLAISGDAAIHTARISGQTGARQGMTATGALTVRHVAGSGMGALDALGATWDFRASQMDFGGKVEAQGGKVSLTTSGGPLVLTGSASIDVSGRAVEFYDTVRAASAGEILLKAAAGNVVAEAGAKLNVSGALGGDAGQIRVSAVNGRADLAAGELLGASPADAQGLRGEGAHFSLDAQELPTFSALNENLNRGGFDGARAIRVRTGDITVAASDTVRAAQVRLTADAGKVEVAGTLDASGINGGDIAIHARDNVTVKNGGKLLANATGDALVAGDSTVGAGGSVMLSSLSMASTEAVSAEAGALIDVSGDQAGPVAGKRGAVVMRAYRGTTGTANSVNVAFGTTAAVKGAEEVRLEGVRVYDSPAFSATTSTIVADTNAFYTANPDAGSYAPTQDGGLVRVLPNVEVRSTSTTTPTDLTISSDINMRAFGALQVGKGGTLTLRSNGDLKINGSLSDGFSSAASSGTLQSGDSFGYELVAGSDFSSADTMATVQGQGNVALASNKLVRTGAGDIRIAAGNHLTMGNQSSVIYTLGTRAPALSDFIIPSNGTGASAIAATFTENGGDIDIAVQGNVQGVASNQLYSNWLFRQGRINASTNGFDASNPQTAWWVRHDQFQQGIAALGGGDVRVRAEGDITNLSVSSVTNGRMNANAPDAEKLVVLGGGDVTISAGNDIAGGQYYVGRGEMRLSAGGAVREGATVGGKPLFTTIAMADTQTDVQARQDVNLQAVINPTMVVQSSTTNSAQRANFNAFGSSDVKRSLFSTYSEDAALSVSSLTGATVMHNQADSGDERTQAAGLQTAHNSLTWSYGAYSSNLQNILTTYPGSLNAVSYQGDVRVVKNLSLMSSPQGDLQLLARGSVLLDGSRLNMGDLDAAQMPLATSSPSSDFSKISGIWTGYAHAVTPVHSLDPNPVRIYAVNGDVAGKAGSNNQLVLPKPARIMAGRDFSDLTLNGQNLDSGDVTYVKVGRDLYYGSGSSSHLNEIKLGGPGRLEIEVGRSLDLGVSGGISTVGDLSNSALSDSGASIHLATGVKGGVDYAGAVQRLTTTLRNAVDRHESVSDSTLWQVRWLSGNDGVGAKEDPAALLHAVEQVVARGEDVQRERVRSMFYQALRDTGRDHNNPDSPYAADYQRGYDAVALLFPEKDGSGAVMDYSGELNMFASSVKTKRGGDIEFMVPGGGMLGGLAQISDSQLPPGRKTTDLGTVAIEEGSIRGFTRDNILVNQSRILTVGGGDVLLWSSLKDIDAGKGKRTAVTVPPPIVKIDASGNVSVELQGAATGSGIGALAGIPGVTAGEVDLIAPRGAVNAGDAGIRAGNLNIAAQVVIGADNISVSGSSSGVPVTDTSALAGSLSSASGVGADATKSVASDVSRQVATQSAASAFSAKHLLPSFISVEVIGLGD